MEQWIPSHSEIPLNDRADTLANIATQLPLIDIIPFPNPSKLVSQSKALEKAIVNEWFLAEKSNHSVIQRSLDSPESNMANIHKNLSFQMTVFMTWVRTGHTPLNDHLFRMGKRDDPYCDCSTQEQLTRETIDHFLFVCPKRTTARNNTIKSLDLPLDLVEIMANRISRHTLLRFIKQSRRFK